MSPLPPLLPVRQRLRAAPLADIEGTVHRQVLASRLPQRLRPGARVAITAGSRGIANIDRIIAATVRALRTLGFEPFIVPAMGSHGGGTAEGQVEILRALGITEERVGAPIRSSMAVVRIGQTPEGMPVHVDRLAWEADGIVVVNRVKKHTDFTGPIESGLLKMIAIGLGKKTQAELIHAYGAEGLRRFIPAVARVVLATGRIVLGLAVLEDGYDQTAAIVAVEPEEMEAVERRLLRRAKAWLPRLPFATLDLLIVDWMGKDISGTGMDTNVIGRVKIPGERDPRRPRVRLLVVLDLTPASHGNAIGLGLADLTTARLLAKMDRETTYVNGITSGFLERVKIPVVLPDDRTAIETALSRLDPETAANPRVVRLRDTLHLGEFFISPALRAEAEARGLEIVGPPQPVRFSPDGRIEPFEQAFPGLAHRAAVGH